MKYTISRTHYKVLQLTGKKLLFEVLAMVMQVGCPTFLWHLLCAELHRNELIYFINILIGVNNMDIFERYKYLSLNPVFPAHHFSQGLGKKKDWNRDKFIVF